MAGIIKKVMHPFQHQQGAGGAGGKPESKTKHALHELKDFVFSPTGLIFTLGLILLVHWYSTKDHAKK